jgi:hypothetical protein
MWTILAMTVTDVKIPDHIAPKLKLQRGEVVRYVEFGGGRRIGPFEMVLVLSSQKGKLVTNKGTVELPLSAVQRRTLRNALRTTTVKGLNGKPREQAYWQSAADGIDVYLRFNTGRKEQTWTNYAYYEKEPEAAMVKLVRELYASGRKKLKMDW